MADGWMVPGFSHVQELGAGVTGRVMLALDEVTQTKVAIKYLDRRLDGDEAFLSRFRAVARRLSQLEDPNVVDFYEFVESPEGTAIVMERVEGLGLRRLLASQGPTGPLAALAMVSGSLLGLAAAHAKAIAHGTLRPAEILIDGEGNCRLTDFALARSGTEAQTIPAYAAPELWDGGPASVASDLYAVSAVFFECLTGHPPYGGRTQAAIAKQHREAAIPVEMVPGPLRELIALGLAKDPNSRPESAADFLGAVEDAAVDAYGPAWLAQGRSRLTELAEQAARQPEPAPGKAPKAPKPKPAKAPKAPAARMAQPAAVPSAWPDPPGTTATAPKTTSARPDLSTFPPPSAPEGGGQRGRPWVIAAALAVVVIAGSTVGAALFLGGDDNDSVGPTGPATSESTRPAAPPGPADPAAAALATRVQQATSQASGASFTYKRAGCCGGKAAAKGTFNLVNGSSPSYSMNVAGTGETRRATRAVLVGDVSYIMVGRTWRTIPAGGQSSGYPALAAQARSASAVSNIVALLNSSTTFKREGQIYKGTAPMDRLTRLPEIGPLYTQLVSVSGAQQVSFALRLDRAGRPAQLWFRAAGTEKTRTQTISANYAKWGRAKVIAAPRIAGQ
ncbi:serine/threonine-protein kinase [Actinomadura sp. SCN-SB]|uniref:serine/threonine-protein kinase n=1 Tax=Actinomadura sp. SCN-SB TaxID=3373092 RepID=UPI00375129D7